MQIEIDSNICLDLKVNTVKIKSNEHCFQSKLKYRIKINSHLLMNGLFNNNYGTSIVRKFSSLLSNNLHAILPKL